MKEGLPKKPPKESKVEAPMLRDTKDPKQFAEEHGALVRERIARRLQILQEDRAARLAATSQEPKPEPVADPAAAPDALIDSSSSATTDPVKPDAVNPVSGVTAEPADMQVSRPTRRRQGGRNAQQPTPVTPPTQPTPAATVLPADPTPPVADPVVDPTTSTIDIPADVKIADDVTRDMQIKQIDQLLNLPGIDDATRVKLEALKKSSVISDADLAALQEEIQDMNASATNTGVVGDLQPRRRRVNKPRVVDSTVAAAAVAATVPDALAPVIADGGMPAGVNPDKIPVLNDPHFGTLTPGERAHYWIKNRSETVVVERTPEGKYVFSHPDGKLNKPLSLEEIEVLAEYEGWEFYAEGLRPEDFEKKELVLTDAEKLNERIIGLTTLVNETRLAYVRTDYEQDTAFKKLKHFFNIGIERGDVDTKAASEQYNLQLTHLKDAELEKLRQSGLTGEDLKKEMVRLLDAFTLVEKANLKLNRITVEGENKKWSGKVGERIESMGKWYNGLSTKQKLVIGGLGLATAGVSFATAGTAVGTAAAAGLLLKRVVTTAGAKVAADMMLDGAEEWVTKWLGQKKQKEQLQDLEALNTPFTKFGSEGLSPEAIEKLNAFLTGNIDSLGTRLQKQKRNAHWRKAATWGAAIAATSYFAYRAGVSVFGSGGGGMTEAQESAAKIKELAGNVGVDQTTPAPTPGASAPAAVVERVAPAASAVGEAALAPVPAASGAMGAASGVPGSSVVGSSLDSGISVPEITPPTGQILTAGLGANEWSETPYDFNAQLNVPTVISEVPVSREVSALLADHKITPDGRGLWGVLDKRLEGIPKGPGRDRMIQSLENIMRAKLDVMPPEDRMKLGFPKSLPNGKVNLDFIRVGDTIGFSKLLTPQEIQSVLDGKSVGAPNGLGHLATQGLDRGLLNNPKDFADAVEAFDKSTAELNVKAANDAAYEDTVRKLAESPMRPIATLEAANDASFKEAMVANYDATIRQYTDPKQFLIDNPGRKVELFRVTSQLHSEILSLNLGEESVPTNYDYNANGERLGNTKVTQVMRDFGSVRPRDIGVNPLHPEQEKEFMNFMKAAQKAFGPELSAPKAGESVTYYVGRMATAALRTGKDIGGFYKHNNLIAA